MITEIDDVEGRKARRAKLVRYMIVAGDEAILEYAAKGLRLEDVIQNQLEHLGDPRGGRVPDDFDGLVIWQGTQPMAVLRVIDGLRREVTTFDHGAMTQVYPALPRD